MAAKFELKKAANGQFMFNLKGGNGEVILTSETYVAKAAAKDSIASVRVNALIDARYDRKTSGKGEPCFVLKAANNETLGRSEMYSSVQAMEGGIAAVKRDAPGAQLEDLT